MIGNGRHSDYLRDVSRGLVQGASFFGAFGEKITSGPDSGLLWPNGAFNVAPATTHSIEVVSTSAQDGVGGTGIIEIHIHYIDGDWNDATESLIMNGLTPVTMTATDVRFIQCVHIGEVGTGKAAAGDISLYDSAAPSVTYSYIATGETRCISSARMVPSGKRLLIYGAVASSISGTAAAGSNVRLASTEIFAHQYIDPVILIPFSSLGFQDNSFGIQFDPPIPVSEKMIIGMTFSTDKASIISGSWWGILEDL